MLLARVPLNALKFENEPTGSRFTARLTIVARVKDKKSEVVQYAAQTYDLASQAGQALAGAGDILFYRDVTLPPGSLVLEVAAFDVNSQHGGVQRIPLEASGTEPKGLRAGGLIIAHKLQRRGGPTAAESGMPALQFGDWLLLPNLGEPLLPTSDLVFGFEAYADPRGAQTDGTRGNHAGWAISGARPSSTLAASGDRKNCLCRACPDWNAGSWLLQSPVDAAPGRGDADEDCAIHRGSYRTLVQRCHPFRATA